MLVTFVKQVLENSAKSNSCIIIVICSYSRSYSRGRLDNAVNASTGILLDL